MPVAPGTYRYILAHYEWEDSDPDDIAYWRGPAGYVASLNLRPYGARVLPHTRPAEGWGLFAMDIRADVPRTAIDLGQDLNSRLAAQVAANLRAALDLTPGDLDRPNLLEDFWAVLNEYADPDDSNLVPPMTPNHRGLMEWNWGGHSLLKRERFDRVKHPRVIELVRKGVIEDRDKSDIVNFDPGRGKELIDYAKLPVLRDLSAKASRDAACVELPQAVAVKANDDTHANLLTAGTSRNSGYASTTGLNGSPTPTYERAAAVAGVAAYYGNIDPARPFQTLPVRGVLAPAVADRFTREERDLLLHGGVATLYFDASGVARIDRLISEYQTNEHDAADTALLDLNTALTLSYLRYDFRSSFTSAFPRHKLADDGIRTGFGQAVVTPKIAKAWCLTKFRQWESLGLVEDYEQFKRDLVVVRNESDPNRLDFFLPPDLVNQLRVAAVQIGFRL